MSNIILYVSGLMGELTLKYLDEIECYTDVVSLNKNLLRRKTYGDFSNYKNKFNIIETDNQKFQLSEIKNKKYQYAVTIDWIKDYFVDTEKPFTVYHSQPSLLPLYRGYGAISYQFLMGVKISGITVYEENNIIDGGDIIFQEKVNINYGDTPYNFIDKCSKILSHFIYKLKNGASFNKKPQDNNKAFYIARTRNKQKIIDFNSSAVSVYNFITAYAYPFNGSYFYYDGIKCKAHLSSIEKWQGNYGKAGEIIDVSDYGIEVACGEGSVIIKEYSSVEDFNFIKEKIINN